MCAGKRLFLSYILSKRQAADSANIALRVMWRLHNVTNASNSVLALCQTEVNKLVICLWSTSVQHTQLVISLLEKSRCIYYASCLCLHLLIHAHRVTTITIVIVIHKNCWWLEAPKRKKQHSKDTQSYTWNLSSIFVPFIDRQKNIWQYTRMVSCSFVCLLCNDPLFLFWCFDPSLLYFKKWFST